MKNIYFEEAKDMVEIWSDFVKIIITTKDERINKFFPENQIIENILKLMIAH